MLFQKTILIILIKRKHENGFIYHFLENRKKNYFFIRLRIEKIIFNIYYFIKMWEICAIFISQYFIKKNIKTIFIQKFMKNILKKTIEENLNKPFSVHTTFSSQSISCFNFLSFFIIMI